MSNCLLYTHILISQKIYFVTKVRFSQKQSHNYIYKYINIIYIIIHIINIYMHNYNILYILYTTQEKHRRKTGFNVLPFYIKETVVTGL